MGVIDFLKAFLPDFNINVNIDNSVHVDNRKIEVKESSIIVGGQTINDPKIVEAFHKKLAELSKEESLPFQLIHEDLAQDYIEYERAYELSKDNLHTLSGLLPKEELEKILMARRVMLAYKNHESTDLIAELERQLDEHYPKYGKRVYNLMGGGYFDELIMPFAKIHIERGTPEKFAKFYKDILDFFPLAIFVGNTTTEDKLKRELLRRLKMRGIPFLRIHAAGDVNIKKVMHVTESGILKGYQTDDRRYTTGIGIKGQIFEITISD